MEWLGEVPNHWRVSRVSRISQSGMGQTILREMLDDVPTEVSVPVYSASESDAVFGWLTNPDVRLNPGDIIIGARGSIGMARKVPTVATCTQTTIWLKLVDSGLSGDFLHWVMIAGREGLFPFDKTAIPMLTVEQVRSGQIPWPPLGEQRAIADLLDRETAKIDALVEAQRRLVALLKEKRQAVISHAVTRGLDPNVTLKRSGTKWLGDVPAHWTVKPLMRLTAPGRDIMYGIVLPGPNAGEGIPIVKGGDVRRERLRLSLLNWTTREIEAPFARARLQAGDIVYSIRGSIGDSEQVPAELEGANITQDVARISPARGVNHRWLLHVMRARLTFVQLEQGSLGAAVRGINIFDLKRARVSVPPTLEQETLANWLDGETEKIDSLIAEISNSLNLLQERRAALISAAVTGKIDVRGLAATPAAAQAA